MTIVTPFKPTPGYDNCPKCFGWQVRDFTPRDFKGWPTGPADIRDCDHCGGKGEVLKPKPDPWRNVERVDIKPEEVVIEDVPLVDAEGMCMICEGGGCDACKPQPEGWPLVNFGKDTIKPSGWPQGTPTHATQPPAATGWPSPPAPSGWPSMHKEPGK